MTKHAVPVRLHPERELERLGPEWDELFAIGGAGLQTRREWFAASATAALPPGASPQFVAITGADGPLAMFPMRDGPGGWGSLTTPYTCIYQPLLRPGARPDLLGAAFLTFARYSRRWPVTKLEALDPEWLGLASLRAGFAEAGMPTRTFEHFGNWHETIPAGSWDAYRDARPGALRETIRRKTRAVERAGDVRIEIARRGPRLAEFLAAYEAVYARSWKEQEPYPEFNNALVRGLAEAGILRIGVMWSGERPVAAQYWSVLGHSATVLKLAHDESAKALSPGTVLTAHVIRELVEVDHVTELDFGRGDDPYKKAWAGQRRRRIGLLAFNPTSAVGLGQLFRQDGGRLLRFARSFLENKNRSHVIGRSVMTRSQQDVKE